MFILCNNFQYLMIYQEGPSKVASECYCRIIYGVLQFDYFCIIHCLTPIWHICSIPSLSGGWGSLESILCLSTTAFGYPAMVSTGCQLPFLELRHICMREIWFFLHKREKVYMRKLLSCVPLLIFSRKHIVNHLEKVSHLIWLLSHKFNFFLFSGA
jgi:hypothetical protein